MESPKTMTARVVAFRGTDILPPATDAVEKSDKMKKGMSSKYSRSFMLGDVR